MPKVLDKAEIDPFAQQVAEEIAAAGEREADVIEAGIAPDEGLQLGAVIVAEGRAAARMAWSWNGTPSLLPLAWNPDGTRNDGGMAYLLKRHCRCCGNSGFKIRRCPNCVKNTCGNCRTSTQPEKIIKNFYLDPEEVPYPEVFYGNIDCFLIACVRRESSGFKTDREMRIHAASRHKMEYQAFRESQEAEQTSEVADLRKRLDQLTELLITQNLPKEVEKPVEEPAAGKKPRLYVSRKDRQEQAAGGVAT